MPRIFERLNIAPATVASELENALATFPVVSGSASTQVTVATRLRQTLERAQDEMRTLEGRVSLDRAYAAGDGAAQR